MLVQLLIFCSISKQPTEFYASKRVLYIQLNLKYCFGPCVSKFTEALVKYLEDASVVVDILYCNISK